MTELEPNAVDAAILASVAPVRETLERVEREIAETQLRLETLRAQRARLGRVLNAADPDHKKPGPKPGPKPGKSNSSHVGPERRAQILDAVRGRFAGGTFTAAEVQPIAGIHITSLHKFLKEQHDAGAIILDHKGGPRGQTKFYRLP